MKIISRPFHAVLDYIYGAAALAAPKIAGFEDQENARALSVAAGVGTLVSAVSTKHEGGIVKLLPFNTHLKVDTATGLFYLAAPWLMGFAENRRARNTFLGLGLLSLAVVALTQPDTE
ncbi:MAG TPA: hypothetical protein VF681_03890 [Abditibacteriaceae bacterium]|jgi:hypothetical protein